MADVADANTEPKTRNLYTSRGGRGTLLQVDTETDLGAVALYVGATTSDRAETVSATLSLTTSLNVWQARRLAGFLTEAADELEARTGQPAEAGAT